MVAAAVVGSAVVGAVVSSSASSKAANAQQNAANTASGEEKYQYDTTNANEAPIRAAGLSALSQLNSGTAPGGQFSQNYTGADLTSDPGYQFRLAQGAKGVANSGSAAGMTLSGAQLKATDQYNQGFASNEYNNAYSRFTNDQTNRYNRLYSLAGLGQNATAVTGNIGATTAAQIGSNTIGAGNAQAAGYVGQANAVNSGLSTLSNYYQQQNAAAGTQSSYAPASTSGYTGAATTPGYS
jgi:hypothetical protein